MKKGTDGQSMLCAAPVPAPRPFDREYVHGYLEGVLEEMTGNADPEVQKLLVWLQGSGMQSLAHSAAPQASRSHSGSVGESAPLAGGSVDDTARMEAEARSAILRWGYGNFARMLAAVSGDAVGGVWREPEMAFCPACFVEVTKEQADEQTRDARRYRWLRDTLHQSVGGSVTVNDERLVYDEPTPGAEVRVQWYPDTPVGFYVSEASTLDEAIDAAMGDSLKVPHLPAGKLVNHDAARMEWLEELYSAGPLHSYAWRTNRWKEFMTQVARVGFRAAIDAAMTESSEVRNGSA